MYNDNSQKKAGVVALIWNTLQKSEISKNKEVYYGWGPLAHACNPIYLGGWDLVDCGLRPVVEANSSWDPIPLSP
jgi:hypothetical protein